MNIPLSILMPHCPPGREVELTHQYHCRTRLDIAQQARRLKALEEWEAAGGTARAVAALEGPSHVTDAKSADEKIMNALQVYGPMEQNELQKITGFSVRHVFRRLQELMTSGKVECRGTGHDKKFHRRFLLLALCLCASVVQATNFSEPPAEAIPSPQSAMLVRAVRLAVAGPQANAQTTLSWTAGDPPQTLVNYSNRTATAVGAVDLVAVTGLVAGSTNTFAVTNAAGNSNLATVVAQRATNRIVAVQTITVYSVPLIAGRTNWLATTTNLTGVVLWTRERNLGTNAGTFSWLVTNGQSGAKFYQLIGD